MLSFRKLNIPTDSLSCYILRKIISREVISQNGTKGKQFKTNAINNLNGSNDHKECYIN